MSSQFYLNLPTKRREHIQVCLLCQKPYKTEHKQQRYCNSPCMPITAKERRAGITDAVRRGEAVAVPCPDYGKTNRGKPRGKAGDKESLGETSRNWLSMRL